MIATKTRSAEHDESLLTVPGTDIKALRCAAIFGANASGKSNVLRAMQRFSSIVSNSQRKWKPTAPIPAWDPFLLDDQSKHEDTLFEIDFVVDSTVYNYGFRFTDDAFTEEWLLDQTVKTRTLFRRSSKNGNAFFDFPGNNLASKSEDQRLLDLIGLQTRTNSLFLSSAAQSNHEFLSTIYQWIEQRFNILRPQNDFFRSYTAGACETPKHKERIKALLAAADTGIVDFNIAEEQAPEQIRQALKAAIKVLKANVTDDSNLEVVDDGLTRDQITMLHKGGKNKSYPLPFDEESSGTRAYFYMLGPILQELEEGSVLLVDELESSLHPRLAKIIVQMFNSPEFNPKGAQLIFATHALSLLDLDLMRRDQFWITERSEIGSTILASLSDFRVRKGQNLASAYIHGRFGGVPFLDEELLQRTLQSFAEDGIKKDEQNETSG